jgi:hypothetical protein
MPMDLNYKEKRHMRFQVLWDVTFCHSVSGLWLFEPKCCLHLQGSKRKRNISEINLWLFNLRLRISLYSQIWQIILAVIFQTQTWKILCSSINHDAVCYVIFYTFLLPNLPNFKCSRHYCVFRYAHDMFMSRTHIENGLLTYDVKLPAWLLYNS